VPRDYSFKLNKKVRASALCGALSRRASESQIVVLDALEFDAAKTKNVVALLAKFELGEALVVLPGRNENVELSARNLQAVTVLPAEGLNVYDVLNHRTLVMTRQSVEAVTARLGK
jgi:large subunit ribosomal protein L4